MNTSWFTGVRWHELLGAVFAGVAGAALVILQEGRFPTRGDLPVMVAGGLGAGLLYLRNPKRALWREEEEKNGG